VQLWSGSTELPFVMNIEPQNNTDIKFAVLKVHKSNALSMHVPYSG